MHVIGYPRENFMQPLNLSFKAMRASVLQKWENVRAVHRGGGGQQGRLPPPQRKLNLQSLFYFKYIGQDKSCLIFKHIGVLSSFAPWQKNPAYGPGKRKDLTTTEKQIIVTHLKSGISTLEGASL